MTPTETYLPNARYDALIDALRQLRPDPITGELERHQFVEVLGETASIWPASVLDDPARDSKNEMKEVA